MKKFVVITIVLLALAVRFYNFSNRIDFSAEQGISLTTSAQYLKQFSFLGLQNIQRITSSGHHLYSGAWFGYTLTPLILIFNYDPVLITACFALLNVATGLFLLWLTKNKYGFLPAIFALILFLFNSTMSNLKTGEHIGLPK